MASIFTKIINREISSEIIFEDEYLIVIKDIHPKAKTHLLIIPKKEIPTVNDLQNEDNDILLHIFDTAKKLALDLKISEGYQLHFNVGALGGQEVMHLHMHLMSDL